MRTRASIPGGVRGPLEAARTVKAAVAALVPRHARSLAREAWCLGTHLALYPLGFIGSPMRDYGDQPRYSAAHSATPVVLLHGYFHNRSGFFFLARRLRREGFRWVYGMNYSPIGTSIPALAEALKRNVDAVLESTGASQVHIVGHSLGGLVARWYVQELGGEEHVERLITIGTPHRGTWAAYAGLGRTANQMRPGSDLLNRLEMGLKRCSVQFVNLYSDLDVLIVPPTSAVLPDGPTVTNQLVRDVGHTSLLISGELIAAVTDHLTKSSSGVATVHPLRREA